MDRAYDIYERAELNAEQGEPAHAHVYDDIADMSIPEMEDYFGDLDPIAFL